MRGFTFLKGASRFIRKCVTAPFCCLTIRFIILAGSSSDLTTASAGCTSGTAPAASAASAAAAAALMLRQWQNIGGGRTKRSKNAPLRASRPTAMHHRARISPPSLRGRIRTRHRMQGRFAPFSLSLCGYASSCPDQPPLPPGSNTNAASYAGDSHHFLSLSVC